MAGPADPSGGDPLDAVVAEYLEWVEAGVPPDRAELLDAYPDLADRLRAFFADLDRLGTQGEAFRLPDLSLPADFGDYEFVAEVGRGGMGVVYKARQKSLGRVVALKMILAGPLAGPEALQRFREEAETVSRLDHPHVVPVYEVGEHRGLPYFTMPLVDGHSLTAGLDRYPADPKGAAALLVKVCDAVHHAHQRGVLHRDLKPGNILVDAAGEPHVTDFGLARRLEEARTLTATGAVLGTPEYMAPEQAAGAKDVTTAADVYGLGATLYALLTGQPPFRADTAYATLRRVIEEPSVPPRRARRGVPRDLETVCLKCLEKDPAKRYPSVADLAADLARWLRGEPVAARPAGTLERVGRWARRRPTAAALLLVSLVSAVLVLGGGTVLLWQLSAANGQLTAANHDLGVTAGELQATLGDLGGANARLDESLWLSRREVYNQQLARVGAVFETDPRTALDLLYDTDACPIDERDAAWRFYENAARGYDLGSRPGTIVARSPAARQREHQHEERPHDPHQGHRWALVRAGDEPPTLARAERHEAELARPLRVVDLLTGEVKATVPVADLGRKLTLSGTVISRDGETVAWVRHDAKGQSLVACDVRTGKTFDPAGGAKVAGPQFLTLGPTGRLLLWVNAHEYGKPEATRLVEVRTGKLVHEFGPELEPVSAPVFSPDGRHLAFWSSPKEGEYAVTLFDTETKTLLPAVPGDPDLTASRTPKGAALFFSPDGRHLLWFQVRAAKEDDPKRTVELVVREVAGGAVKPARTLEFPHAADQVQVSPDGRLVGVAVRDGSVHLIDTTTWTVRRRLAGTWHGREFAFGRDGRVYTSEESGLSAWDADTGERRAVRRGDHGHVLGVSDRGEVWTTPHVSSNWYGLPVTTWPLAPRTAGLTVAACGWVTGVRFSADGAEFQHVQTVRRRVKDDSVFDEPFKEFVFDSDADVPRQKGYWLNRQRVYDDHTTLRLDLATGRTTEHKGRLPGEWVGELSDLYRWATSATGRESTHTDRRGEEWAFAADEDRRPNGSRATWLTHAATKERRRLPFDVPAKAIVLGPTPDGQCVLVGNPDGAVELRDVWTGRLRATLAGHTATVYHALWAPDGQAVATLAADGTMKVWPMRATAAVARWPADRMAFSADGESIVVRDRNSDQVLTRSLRTGRVERAFPRPTDDYSHDPRLVASADGRYLFAVGHGRPYIHDLATGTNLSGPRPKGIDPIVASAAAASGAFVVTLEKHRVGGTDEKPEYELRLVRRNLPDQAERVLARFPAAEDWSGFLDVTADARAVVVGTFAQTHRGADGKETHRPTLTLRWYDPGTGEAIPKEVKLPSERTRHTSNSPIHAHLDPGGKFALVHDPDNSFRVYDLDEPDKARWRLPDRWSYYKASEFSPDGRWLAAATDRGVVHVWEVETGRRVAADDLRRVVPSGNLPLTVLELRFDPAGRRLAARVKPWRTVSEPPEEVVVWDFTPTRPGP